MKAWMNYAVTSSDNNSFYFETSKGAVYELSFGDYYLHDYFEKEVVVKSMCLTRVPPNIRGKGCNHKDGYVHPTIASIILKYLDIYPNAALLYVCHDNDKLGKARHRLFDRWYRSEKQLLAKYDTNDNEHQHDFYSSIVMRRSNPTGLYLQDAFKQTLKRYFPDDDRYPMPEAEWRLKNEEGFDGMFHLN
ncbi:hypothetical protein SAMN05444266_106461 [Chitinophaga jiangningensis]|uniref:Uncharacterized protein n=1 Tax=Chitinophaga jiangningensis TaxID=1419482 RepID=A0A1M7G9I2_9BACT|nr:DUF6169 family protein [Chitinophaga jiangningensis]SHM12953.1 hypothetical protein SAMN05444266_106461 [Chitinophaga jiangningensis]